MNQEIIKVVEEYKKAIHTQDEAAFKSLWAGNEKVSLISITRYFNGIEEIYQDFLIDLIQKTYQSIELISDQLEIKLISENLAIVIFSYHTECIKRDTLEAYGIQGLETQVMIKENNQWKMQHIHYSK